MPVGTRTSQMAGTQRTAAAGETRTGRAALRSEPRPRPPYGVRSPENKATRGATPLAAGVYGLASGAERQLKRINQSFSLEESQPTAPWRAERPAGSRGQAGGSGSSEDHGPRVVAREPLPATRRHLRFEQGGAGPQHGFRGVPSHSVLWKSLKGLMLIPPRMFGKNSSVKLSGPDFRLSGSVFLVLYH